MISAYLQRCAITPKERGFLVAFGFMRLPKAEERKVSTQDRHKKRGPYKQYRGIAR